MKYAVVSSETTELKISNLQNDEMKKTTESMNKEFIVNPYHLHFGFTISAIINSIIVVDVVSPIIIVGTKYAIERVHEKIVLFSFVLISHVFQNITRIIVDELELRAPIPLNAKRVIVAVVIKASAVINAFCCLNLIVSLCFIKLLIYLKLTE